MPRSRSSSLSIAPSALARPLTPDVPAHTALTLAAACCALIPVVPAPPSHSSSLHDQRGALPQFRGGARAQIRRGATRQGASRNTCSGSGASATDRRSGGSHGALRGHYVGPGGPSQSWPCAEWIPVKALRVRPAGGTRALSSPRALSTAASPSPLQTPCTLTSGPRRAVHGGV